MGRLGQEQRNSLFFVRGPLNQNAMITKKHKLDHIRKCRIAASV